MYRVGIVSKRGRFYTGGNPFLACDVPTIVDAGRLVADLRLSASIDCWTDEDIATIKCRRVEAETEIELALAPHELADLEVAADRHGRGERKTINARDAIVASR